MDSVTGLLSTPVQQEPRLAATSSSSPADAVQDKTSGTQDSQGDTVTISEKGKQLAKGEGDKKEGHASSKAISGAGLKPAQQATQKAATADLQDTKNKITNVKAKIEAEKLQAENDPSQGDNVKLLNVKLASLNEQATKDKVKVSA